MTPNETPLPRGVFRHGKRYRTKVPGTGKWATHGDPYALGHWKQAAQKEHAASRSIPPLPADAPASGPTVTSATSFATFAREVWLVRLRNKVQVSSTVDKNSGALRLHLEPEEWTQRPMSSITARELQSWLDVFATTHNDHLTAAGRRTIGRRYYHHLTVVIRDVFALAVRYHDETGVVENPAAKLALPAGPKVSAHFNRAEKRPRQSAEVSDIAALAPTLHGNDRLPLALEFLLGLRGGEAFGVPVGAWDAERLELSIYQMYGLHRRRDDDRQRYIKTWTKTPSSERTLSVPPTLAQFINSEVERIYGHHPVGDPWWDEPCRHNLDPEVRLNRHLPMCVGVAGPWTFHDRVGTFRRRVQARATELGIDVRFDDARDEATLIPHDIRAAIGAVLHHAGVPEQARSAFLGHHFAGAPDASKTTAGRYSPTMRSALRNIANLIETKLIPHVRELVTPAERVDLVTLSEAATLLGLPEGMTRRRLRSNGVQAQPNPWRVGNVKYYRPEDVLAARQLPGLPADAVTCREAAHLLFPQLTPHSAFVKVSQLIQTADLEVLNRPRRPKMVTSASVAAALSVQARIDAGHLLHPREVTELTGYTLTDLVDAGITTVRLGRQSYVPVEVARRLEHEPLYISHRDAAADLGVTLGTYRALVVRLDPNLRDAPHLRAAEFQQLSKRQAELLEAVRLSRRAQLVTKQPPESSWVSVTAAAASLGVTTGKVVSCSRAEEWPLREFDNVLYARRSDIRHLELRTTGFERLVDLVGRYHINAGQLRSWIHRSGAASHRAGNVHYASREALDRWITKQVTNGTLLTTAQTAALLACSEERVSMLVADSTLTPVAQAPPSLFGRSRGRLHLFTCEDVEDLRRQRVPADGWLTVADVCRSTGLSDGAVLRAVARGQVQSIRDLHRLIWVEPAAPSILQRPESSVTIRELLEHHQMDGPDVARILAKRARAGQFPGAFLHQRTWMLPAALLDATTDELLGPEDDPREAMRGLIAAIRAETHKHHTGGTGSPPGTSPE